MLIAHYPLTEDSGGTAYDYSGNGNDGTVTGATQGTTGGILGSTAYDFDGTDDDVDTGGGIIGGLGEVTISGWAKFDNLTDNHPIFSATTSNVRHQGLYSDGGSDFRFRLETGSSTSAVAGIPQSNFSAGEWNLFTVTYDGSTVTAWMNSDSYETASLSGSLLTPSGNLLLGSLGTGDFLAGDLSHVRIFDHALTPSEIQYLAQRPYRSRIYTDVKDAGSSISPDIQNATYTLNGETVQVYVTGSPDSASPETQAVTLDGSSSFTLSWASSHQFFQITAVAESSDPTTASQIDSVGLG